MTGYGRLACALLILKVFIAVRTNVIVQVLLLVKHLAGCPSPAQGENEVSIVRSSYDHDHEPPIGRLRSAQLLYGFT